MLRLSSLKQIPRLGRGVVCRALARDDNFVPQKERAEKMADALCCAKFDNPLYSAVK